MSRQELRIDDEFAALIPPLTDDEYTRLEQSIISEDCHDAIVVWNDIIVDGHNRYKICKQRSIDFQTVQKSFSSRQEVILWIIQNQLGRRNLNDFQRVEIVRKYEEAVKAQAKQRQRGGQGGILLPEILPEANRNEARDELGAMAGVSGKTYQHATAVLDNAPEAVINATRNNSISINAAYEVTKLPEPKQAEIAERIEHGENAKTVISEVKSRNKKSNTADDVQTPSATSETSPNNQEGDVPMNEPHEVSTNIPAEAQTQQIDKHTQLQKEATEHEILQQTQPTSNANQNVTIPSDKEPLLQHTYTGSSQEINNHSQNENEIEPEKPVIVNINITEKKYNIIYAEPSWENDQSSEELLKLPVRRVADENCTLFLWVNAPRLPEDQKVINQWGFTYRTIAFVWSKIT